MLRDSSIANESLSNAELKASFSQNVLKTRSSGMKTDPGKEIKFSLGCMGRKL